jgi:hypothetical protein
MPSVIKILVALLAIAGLAAIGYYLYLGQETPPDVAVSVQPAPEPAAPAAPAQPAQPEQPPAPEPLTDAGVAARLTGAADIERGAIAAEIAARLGAGDTIAMARRFMSGPAETRNYDASYHLAQAARLEFDSPIAAYLAALHHHNGWSVERDLDRAMALYGQDNLADSPHAAYRQALILSDPAYPGADAARARSLLQSVIASEGEGSALSKRARTLLEKLG